MLNLVLNRYIDEKGCMEDKCPNFIETLEGISKNARNQVVAGLIQIYKF
jgi:nucleoside-triphosphatase THEP1